jgi:hypothetical protein
MRSKPKPEDFSISSLIRKVHNELIKSQELREGENLPPLFEVESLVIEANFIVSQSTDQKGKIDLKIVGVDGVKSNREEEVHKLILKLKTADFENTTQMKKRNKRGKEKGSAHMSERLRPMPERD